MLFEVVNNEKREDGFNSRIMTDNELFEFVGLEENEENDLEDIINILWGQGYEVYDIARSYFE